MLGINRRFGQNPNMIKRTQVRRIAVICLAYSFAVLLTGGIRGSRRKDSLFSRWYHSTLRSALDRYRSEVTSFLCAISVPIILIQVLVANGSDFVELGVCNVLVLKWRM